MISHTWRDRTPTIGQIDRSECYSLFQSKQINEAHGVSTDIDIRVPSGLQAERVALDVAHRHRTVDPESVGDQPRLRVETLPQEPALERERAPRGLVAEGFLGVPVPHRAARGGIEHLAWGAEVVGQDGIDRMAASSNAHRDHRPPPVKANPLLDYVAGDCPGEQKRNIAGLLAVVRSFSEACEGVCFSVSESLHFDMIEISSLLLFRKLVPFLSVQ